MLCFFVDYGVVFVWLCSKVFVKVIVVGILNLCFLFFVILLKCLMYCLICFCLVCCSCFRVLVFLGLCVVVVRLKCFVWLVVVLMMVLFVYCLFLIVFFIGSFLGFCFSCIGVLRLSLKLRFFFRVIKISKVVMFSLN